LDWGEVVFTNGILSVRRSFSRGVLSLPKHGRTRDVPLPDNAVRVLREHRHLRSQVVFCQEDGERLTRDMIKAPFERVVKASGLHRITPHGMRHSYASQLVMAGVPLKAVQELLGHADIRTTMRYAHLAPRAKASYVQCLDEIPDSETPEKDGTGEQ